MAIPSITPAGTPRKDSRAGTAIGRVELLGDRGDVEKSWDIGLGRWTLGSSPQCSIQISDDPAFQACFLELTVGKRYTLLKASGPVCISGRRVREWLIDRLTVVDCGHRRLRINPNSQGLRDQSAVSVVTEERIPEVASRLASYSPEVAMPPSGTRDASSDNATNSGFVEMERRMEELRASVEAIQTNLSAVSDLDAWDQRIEQLASKSISAIEDELGERIRGPLHDEFRRLLLDEKPLWQAPLLDQIKSLENRVVPRIDKWEESIRSTQQGISDINQQLAELTAAFTELVSRSISEPEYSVSTNGFSDYSGDNSEEQEASDFSSRSTDDDLSEDSSNNSEEVFEFQVDDESISLRLSRILGDHVENRSADHVPDQSSGPSPESKIEDAGPSIDGAELATNTDMSTNSIEDKFESLSDRPLSEPKPPREFAEKPVEYPVDSKPQAQRRRGDDSGAYSADSKAGSAEDESIEEYMQRLLHRVRTGQGSEPGASAPKDSLKSSKPKTKTAPIDDGLSSASLSGMIRANSLKTSAVRPPTQPIAEVKSDIQAFRELANSNARRAISRSEVRRQSSNSVVKSMIVAVALVSGGSFFFLDVGDERVRFIGFVVSLIIAGVWGIDTIRELFSIRFHRETADSDESPRDKPKKSNNKDNGSA